MAKKIFADTFLFIMGDDNYVEKIMKRLPEYDYDLFNTGKKFDLNFPNIKRFIEHIKRVNYDIFDSMCVFINSCYGEYADYQSPSSDEEESGSDDDTSDEDEKFINDLYRACHKLFLEDPDTRRHIIQILTTKKINSNLDDDLDIAMVAAIKTFLA